MELKLSNQELVMILVSAIIIVAISSTVIYHMPISTMVEGFIGGLKGASVNYSMGKGVAGSWENSKDSDSCNNWYKSLEANKGSPVPTSTALDNGQLAMFADTRQSPECCPSTYSGSDGCVCPSAEQMKYLNKRGGNRTGCGEY